MAIGVSSGVGTIQIPYLGSLSRGTQDWEWIWWELKRGFVEVANTMGWEFPPQSITTGSIFPDIEAIKWISCKEASIRREAVDRGAFKDIVFFKLTLWSPNVQDLRMVFSQNANIIGGWREEANPVMLLICLNMEGLNLSENGSDLRDFDSKSLILPPSCHHLERCVMGPKLWFATWLECPRWWYYTWGNIIQMHTIVSINDANFPPI